MTREERQHRNAATLARMVDRMNDGPPDQDDRDDDERAEDEAEACRREDWLAETRREEKEERYV